MKPSAAYDPGEDVIHFRCAFCGCAAQETKGALSFNECVRLFAARNGWRIFESGGRRRAACSSCAREADIETLVRRLTDWIAKQRAAEAARERRKLYGGT